MKSGCSEVGSTLQFFNVTLMVPLGQNFHLAFGQGGEGSRVVGDSLESAVSLSTFTNLIRGNLWVALGH